MKLNAVISALRSMPQAAVDSKKTCEEKEGFFLKIALLMNFSWAQTKPLLFYKKEVNEALQIKDVPNFVSCSSFLLTAYFRKLSFRKAGLMKLG